MKRLWLFLLVALGLGSQVFGQGSSKEIIYGTVMSDGYQKITKGAMWGIRPVAKAIYEGSHPKGYTILILEKEYFVRFAENEHNNLDRNYIVFPKGSIVYTDNTGQFYSALCGNKISYICPVEMVKIVEKKVEKIDTFYLEVTKPEEKISFSLKNKNPNINPNFVIVGVTVTVVGIGYLIYSFFSKKEYHGGNNSGTNNNRWRSNPGQGQDPPPNSGEDTGGPVDPPPSGD